MVICGVIAELTLGMKNPELEGPEAPDPEFSSSRSLSYFDRYWHRTEYGSPSVSSEEHETQWNRAGSTPSRQTLRTSALYVILGKNFGPKFLPPPPSGPGCGMSTLSTPSEAIRFSHYRGVAKIIWEKIAPTATAGNERMD